MELTDIKWELLKEKEHCLYELKAIQEMSYEYFMIQGKITAYDYAIRLINEMMGRHDETL